MSDLGDGGHDSPAQDNQTVSFDRELGQFGGRTGIFTGWKREKRVADFIHFSSLPDFYHEYTSQYLVHIWIVMILSLAAFIKFYYLYKAILLLGGKS